MTFNKIFVSFVAVSTGCVALSLTSNAAECVDVPPFIGMYGEWESVATRAEPAEILDEHPEWTVPHLIVGKPAEVCPGIEFTVTQNVQGREVMTKLNYVYDPELGKSFGVIAGSNGTRLKGEIQHGERNDLLTLSDFEGFVVWSETKVWISDDEFVSEGIFEFNNQQGRVWFRTYRKTKDQNKTKDVGNLNASPETS